ncbi:MAG TPA: PKD domain-containing protein, partial [Methanoregulaceae archaeon]|nr:PKD domain-containing protein [Methanoregulaceae archaeon]
MRQKEIPLLFVLLVLLAGVIPAFAAGDASASNTAPTLSDVDHEDLIASQPLFFIENKGQISGGVRFEVISNGGLVYFTGDGATIRVIRTINDEFASSTIGFTYEGAPENTGVYGIDPLPCRVNFMKGDPTQWITGVRTYEAIAYPDLYPGIDLTYEGKTGAIKSSFLVKPGSDPASIKTVYTGHSGLTVAPNGDLHIQTDVGILTQSVPYCYQEIDGHIVVIPASYLILSDDTVGFGIGDYDEGKDLIIDPEIKYSLYLRGVGFASANGVAADIQGNAYVVGVTFPEVLDPYGSISGGTDAIVVKINPLGTAPEYLNYIGGKGYDAGNAIAVDTNGNAYITGSTDSVDFPVVNAIQSANAGKNDAFVVKLNPDGSSFVYSTYVGGTGNDYGYGITLDSQNNAFITGSTESKSFPVNHGSQNTALAGNADAFIVKVNSPGTQFSYSGYYGGTLNDIGYGIDVDGTGAAYITGETFSNNFPLKGAFQSKLGGWSDAFITKVDTAEDAIVYSTYLGGTAKDAGRAIAVDKDTYAHLTGLTESNNFPVKDAFYQAPSSRMRSSFYTRLVPAGNALSLSTYLTGPVADEGRGIAIDTFGNVYIAGFTKDTNLETINAFQPKFGGQSDAFVAKFVPGQKTPELLSYLGGNGKDEGYAIAVDNNCGVYIVGLTRSTDFPASVPYPSAFLPKEEGGFITALKDGDCCPYPKAGFTFSTNACDFNVTFTDTSTDATSWAWQFGDGATSSAQNPDHTYLNAGTYTVNLTVQNVCFDGSPRNSSVSKQVTLNPIPVTVADFNATPTDGEAPLNVTFTDLSLNATSWAWQFGDGTNSTLRNTSHTYTAPGTYQVNLTVVGPCNNDTESKSVTVWLCPPPVANFTFSTNTCDLNVTFTDTSTNNPTSWAWEFGDGTTSAVQSPVHTYSTAGTYAVNLTVAKTCDDGSEKNSTISKNVVVSPVPVTTADFSLDPSSGEAPLNVTFTDLSLNATSWAW